jgi:hypothetical protein
MNVHFFTPSVLNRANIKRNEESGYPNRLKSNVTKTMVPRKRTNCLDDPGILPPDGFSGLVLVFRKSRSRKRPDRSISKSPRHSGKNPVPAIRKLPMGISKERRAVANPNRKRTIPPIISSLFKNPPFLTMNFER